MPVDDERTALRAAVAAVAQRHGDEFAEHARAGTFPLALWQALAEAGFAGVNVSEEDGGPGGTLGDLAAVAEELAAAGCPLMTLVVSPGVCAPLLAKHGTASQKSRWLKPIGAGSTRLAFAMTEAGAGSNSHRIATKAVRTDQGWSVTGEKQFISGADTSDAILVVARTDAAEQGSPAGFSLLLVETNRPGLSIDPIEMQVEAAERQFLVRLDDVQVPEENLLGVPGVGLGALFHGLNPERIISAAICVGLARYCLDKAVAYARERQVWGVPIGAHQAVAHPLAQAYVALEAARHLTQHAVSLHERGAPCGSEANVAKVAAADAAAAALDVAVQTHGGNGLAREFRLAQLWGLVRMYEIAPVSREMALNHLATHTLGLPRSY